MNNRWVDKYTLRYGVGTVVGAVIVASLFHAVHPLIPVIDSWGALVSLAAAGFAFCYVASAPLLVIHVCRWFLFGGKSWWTDHWGHLLATAVFAAVGYLFGSRLNCPDFNGQIGIAAGALLAVLAVQVIAVFTCFRKRAELLSFYERVGAARRPDLKVKATDYDVPEEVQSYRDLREHGNACAIVFFEIGLGLILRTALLVRPVPQNLSHAAWRFSEVICFWILPSVFSLYIAACLEIDFAAEHAKRVAPERLAGPDVASAPPGNPSPPR